MKKEKYLAMIKNKKEKTKKRLLKINRMQIIFDYCRDWRRLNASIRLSAGGVQAVRSWGKYLEKLVNKLNKKYSFLYFKINQVLGQDFVSWEIEKNKK